MSSGPGQDACAMRTSGARRRRLERRRRRALDVCVGSVPQPASSAAARERHRCVPQAAADRMQRRKFEGDCHGTTSRLRSSLSIAVPVARARRARHRRSCAGLRDARGAGRKSVQFLARRFAEEGAGRPLLLSRGVFRGLLGRSARVRRGDSHEFDGARRIGGRRLGRRHRDADQVFRPGLSKQVSRWPPTRRRR